MIEPGAQAKLGGVVLGVTAEHGEQRALWERAAEPPPALVGLAEGRVQGAPLGKRISRSQTRRRRVW